MTYYLITTAVLAFVLHFPITNLVFVMSVRRFERKTGGTLGEQERHGQKQRARFIAILLALIFAALFNYNVFGIST